MKNIIQYVLGNRLRILAACALMLLLFACPTPEEGTKADEGSDSDNDKNVAKEITELSVTIFGKEYTGTIAGTAIIFANIDYSIAKPTKAVIKTIATSSGVSTDISDNTLTIVGDKASILLSAEDGSTQSYTILFVFNLVSQELKPRLSFDDYIRLDWSAIDTASHYEVWRAEATSSSADATLLASVQTQSHIDNTAKNGRFYYWVKACNDEQACTDFSTTSLGKGIGFVSVATRSTDGGAIWSGRHGHSTVVHNNKIWVIGGKDDTGLKGDVWSSEDGLTWQQVTNSASWAVRFKHSSVVFGGKLWLIGGTFTETPGELSDKRKNDVWSSVDGATWTQVVEEAPWGVRDNHASVVFDGKIWISGGSSTTKRDDIWFSGDGATWTQVTGVDTSWLDRYGHTNLVFNGKLFINGGYRSSLGALNDVWSSADGVTWEQISTPEATTWPGRAFHSTTNFKNKLWLIGGRGLEYTRNDVWSSADGVTWTQIANVVPPSISIHHSLVFDDKLWIIGGRTEAIVNSNAVWFTTGDFVPLQ